MVSCDRPAESVGPLGSRAGDVELVRETPGGEGGGLPGRAGDTVSDLGLSHGVGAGTRQHEGRKVQTELETILINKRSKIGLFFNKTHIWLD